MALISQAIRTNQVSSRLVYCGILVFIAELDVQHLCLHGLGGLYDNSKPHSKNIDDLALILDLLDVR
jgi:hypothetical protein